MRVSVDLDETTWRTLRDLAESRRAASGGRASVSALLAVLVARHIKRTKARVRIPRIIEEGTVPAREVA